MNAFPDTGPGTDGRRTAEQWVNAMTEDLSLALMYLKESLTEEDRDMILQRLKLALKEARRFHSDIYRFGEEVHGVSRKDVDHIHV